MTCIETNTIDLFEMAAPSDERPELTADMLATAAHDLRGPLTIILGHLQLLRMPQAGHSVDEALAAIERSAARMLGTVTSVLDERKPVSKATPPAVLRLEPLCRDIVEDLKLAFPNRTLRLRSVADAVVAADRVGVERILTNLITNAMVHTADECGVDVSIVPGHDPRAALVLVVDDGPGVGADQRERIFEPYARGKTTASGSGLGLHISRDLARANGGELSLRERAGRGCCFELRLPVAGRAA